MSNEPRANYGKFANEQRGNSEEFLNELRANAGKFSNEQLVTEIQAGRDISGNMLQLWEQTKDFIKMLAVKYTGWAELDDLRQEGYIGLCEAVRHYDTASNVPFINYAAFWIKQTLQRYVENCGTVVRLPSHAREALREYKRFVSDYQKYYGFAPSEREITAFLGISREKLQTIKQSTFMSNMESLSTPTGEEEAFTLEDTVPSGEDVEMDTVQRLDYQDMKRALWEAVDTLSEEQRLVIRNRFMNDKTLREVGEINGVTIEAARQQQRKALRELRKPSRCRAYKLYYEEYLKPADTCHVGLKRFHETWWSEVETAAILGR